MESRIEGLAVEGTNYFEAYLDGRYQFTYFKMFDGSLMIKDFDKLFKDLEEAVFFYLGTKAGRSSKPMLDTFYILELSRHESKVKSEKLKDGKKV